METNQLHTKDDLYFHRDNCCKVSFKGFLYILNNFFIVLSFRDIDNLKSKCSSKIANSRTLPNRMVGFKLISKTHQNHCIWTWFTFLRVCVCVLVITNTHILMFFKSKFCKNNIISRLLPKRNLSSLV